MKKLLTLFTFLSAASALTAQNVQLHYDMGDTRKFLTSTVETFKTDKYGSTFYFIDMDYGKGVSDGVQGPKLAYFEISRGLKFWNSPFEIHVEYNGGFGQYQADKVNNAYQINDSGREFDIERIPKRQLVTRRVFKALQASELLTETDLDLISSRARKVAKQLVLDGWAIVKKNTIWIAFN